MFCFVFVFFLFFDDSTKGHVHRTVSGLKLQSALGPIIHQTCPGKGPQVSNNPSTKNSITAVLPGLRRKTTTVVCHLRLVHSVQSSQSSELRSSKGFKKTFCFRLLTSFTEILFSFSRRTLSRPAEPNYEQLVGWLWLYCAWLAAPTIQMSWRLVSKQPDVEATWPIVGCRRENNFSNTDLCYKSSFCFALKWLSS